jgi:hypothetical protein
VTNARTATRHALALAIGQFDALRRDDVDGYVDGMRAHEEACSAVGALPLPAFDSESRALLDELIRVNSAALQEIERIQAGNGRRLAGLRQSRGAALAYFASPASTGLQSASA